MNAQKTILKRVFLPRKSMLTRVMYLASYDCALPDTWCILSRGGQERRKDYQYKNRYKKIPIAMATR